MIANRVNQILIGVLIVQLGITAVVLTRGDGTRLAAQRPIVAGFDAAQVTGLAVFDQDAAQPAIELRKVGDAWQLASHFGHPADATKVDAILTKIAGLRTRGAIATTAVRHDQLRVGDQAFEKKLVVTTAKGVTTLLIGNAREGRTNAVRVGGEAGAHAVTTLSAWSVETQPASWIEPVYFEVDRERIARVVVQGPRGAVELDRTDTGWQLTSAGQPVALRPGETLDAAAIEGVIGTLARVTVLEPGDPARDATAPTATISVWVTAADPAGAAVSADQRVPDHTLDVVADGERYWMRERGRAVAGLVAKAGFSQVVEVDRGAFVKAATGVPAPAPKPAPRPRPPG